MLPALAESWSQNGREIEFTLSSGARWEDGQAVTAEDLAFSLGLHAHPESKSISQSMFQKFVEAVEVTGVHTIRVKTRTASYYHLFTLGIQLQIYPAHVYRGDKGQMVWPKKWVGSGDYLLEHFTPDQNLILKNKTDGSRLRIDFVADLDRRIDEVRRERADWAYLSWSEALALHKKSKALDLVYREPLEGQPGVIWLLLNHKNPHLASTPVRQALMYGFDRNRVNQLLFDDLLRIGQSYWPGSHPFAGRPETYVYDPKKAIELLKRAGYRDQNGDGILENGTDLEFEVLMLEQEQAALMDLFAKSMREIGVKVRLNPMGSQEAFRRIGSGEYDAYLLHIDRFYPDMNLKFQFHTQREQKWPVFRFSPAHQAELDQLLEAAEREMSAEIRQRLQKDVNAILFEELPHLFWFEVPFEYWLKAPHAKFKEPPF